MLAELRRWRDRAPDRTAVRATTLDGTTRTTSWSALYDAAVAAAATADRDPPGPGPVVLLVDGSAAALAVLLGLTAAGQEVLLLEEQSSFLADPASPVCHVGATVVIGPDRAAGVPERFGFRSYQQLCRPGAGPPPEPPAQGGVLQLTSGSTGEPKLARQPLRHLVHGGHTYRQLFRIGRSDRVLVPVPLVHSFGLVGGWFAALAAGAELWTLGRFHPGRVRAGLAGGATVLLGTPLLYRLLAPALTGTPRPGRLRVALSSGGPLDPALAAEVGRRLGVPARQIYGSTETGLIAYQPESSARWPDGMVGVAAPGVRLRTEPVPWLPDGTGQLLVQTPTMFTGYAGTVDRTGEWYQTEWYQTGDLARIDRHGRIELLGRKDSFVNVGGRKVNPLRIERIIAEHPGVREVAVYGVTDPGQEQRLHAAVVLVAGTGIGDVVGFCRDRRLQPYEVPHRLHRVPRLPRTPMGKVDRRALPTGAEAG